VRVLEDGKRRIERGDHSGTIADVDDELLGTLFDAGRTPVVTVPMLGVDGAGSESAAVDDADAELLAVNADADRAAAAVAGALGADLVVLTDVAGVYRDPDDASTRIESVATAEDWAALEAAAEGFMTKKVMAAEEALEGGAASVAVANANADAPVTSALDGDATTMLPGALEPGDDADSGGEDDETAIDAEVSAE